MPTVEDPVFFHHHTCKQLLLELLFCRTSPTLRNSPSFVIIEEEDKFLHMLSNSSLLVDCIILTYNTDLKVSYVLIQSMLSITELL